MFARSATSSREATANERESNLAFLAQVDQTLAAAVPDAAQRSRRAWIVLCHVTLSANEFIYIK